MKNFALIILLIMLFGACNKNTSFTITGNVVPPEDGQMILYGFEKGNPVATDTAEIVAGEFTFKGDIDIPDLRLLSVKGKNRYVAQMFLEPGRINITVYPDSFETNVITGSKSQDIFQEYIDEMVRLTKAENELQQRYRQSQISGDQEELEAVQFEFQTMMENSQLYARNFIKEYQESPVAAYVYLMNFYDRAEAEELDSMLNMFEPINSSQFVEVLKDRADGLRASGIGSVAPEIALANPEGNPVTLSQLRGKYVLIDFWASWCNPCIEELPLLKSIYADYSDKGFEIFGVSLDREKQAWLNAIERFGMDWVHVWDLDGETPGETANKYGVNGIPFTVLLDKEGKIIAKNLRGEQLREKISGLLE
ncbi:MAG: AhpC/TSA family protein [Prolixibacteraceae bacterium]|nr:AhpC/TSA family protein [Prolixibacteraceae bacterium]